MDSHYIPLFTLCQTGMHVILLFHQGVFLFFETIFKHTAKLIIVSVNRPFAKVASPVLTSTPSRINKEKILQVLSENKDKIQLVKYRSEMIQLSHQRSILEIAVMVMIISLAYTIFEDQKASSIAVTGSFVVIILPFVVWYHWRHSVHLLSQGWSRYDQSVLLLSTCLGWLWTLTCLLLMISLYTLPTDGGAICV